MRLWPPREVRPPWCVLREGGGAAPVEGCLWSMMVASRASLWKRMLFSGHSSWYFCFRLWRLRCPSRRETPSGTSSSSSSPSFGHRELKVWREYRGKVFNGFMHDLIIFWFWQVNYKLWLCRQMIKEIYFFFVLPSFQNNHEKNKAGIETTFFLLMMEIIWSKKPYTSAHLSRAGRKDFWKV